MNRMVWMIAFVGLIPLFSGCEQQKPHPTLSMETSEEPVESVTPPKDSRFKISRVAVFEDSLAYRGRRGVYVVTDTKTGIEYVGISGIGISETGDHRSGKSTVRDER